MITQACLEKGLGEVVDKNLGRLYVPPRFLKVGYPELIFLAQNWGVWNEFQKIEVGSLELE